MCGIAGFWRRSGLDHGDSRRVERMSSTLVHRGPDDFGYLLAGTDGHVSCGQNLIADFTPTLLLASRRLRILDLSPAGRQPISNESGDIFVVFNGAIHNYVELRSELQMLGHRFRSNTDTEVIVHAFEEWGESCAKRFNGMWAYAIWDSRRSRLICSRDRFGVKPLYVAWHGDTFYFASEAKAILAGGEVEPLPNWSFVHRYLTFNQCENGRDTAFKGITKVPAGSNVIVTASSCEVTTYWSYTDQSEEYDYQHAPSTFRELFRDALRIRLRSDVSVALLLSGGLDSSSIAVHAKDQAEIPHIHAFTAIFPDFYADESRYASIVANAVGMKIHHIEYDASRMLDDLDSLTWHLDAPPQRGQELARWQLLAAVSAHARVVLEGQGADELLAGYPDRYLAPYLATELEHLRPWNLTSSVPRLLRGWRELKRIQPSPTLWSRFIRVRAQAVRPLVSSDLGETMWLEPAVGPARFADPLTKALYRDHASGLLSELLHFGDGISMAHSVESRLPFLDHRLVEFAFGLPFDQKMRGAQGKFILRQAFANDLPAEILNRYHKIGFATPLASWMKQHLGQIQDLLGSQSARERGTFDRQGLADCLRRFERDGASVHQVFRSVALELWFRRFVDSSPSHN